MPLVHHDQPGAYAYETPAQAERRVLIQQQSLQAERKRFEPWQRGSNENMNGLVRQYLPKGTDLSVYSQEHLDAIADQINDRPRKGLGVRSPLAVYRELLINSPQHSTEIH
jgi:hypothetical protein